jgi:3'-phosphoadenosine 5'-phosphosulfate sulfotransferase (PAPS reductase)/FAD synthetase
MIDVPDLVRSGAVEPVYHLSTGKDSVATLCAAREAGLPLQWVACADTGWERAPDFAEHLAAVSAALDIKVRVVGRDGGMRQLVRERAAFPSRSGAHGTGRFCTEKLKTEPLQRFHEEVRAATGRDTVAVLGIRADESVARAAMPPWEWDDEFGCWTWLPIHRWSVTEVIETHHRHGVPLHPLYRQGYDRVGCWPCFVYAGKDEIRRIAQDDPARIAELEDLEREATEERARRNEERPGRYGHPVATAFQTRVPGRVMGIREIVAWSRTTRGGRQLDLLPEAPRGGCAKWGMCDAGIKPRNA